MPFENLNDKLTPSEWGAIMAFVLAVLRIMGEKDDGRFSLHKFYRMIIEGLTCSALGVAIIPIIEKQFQTEDYSIAVGIFVGYFGSQVIRVAAVSLFNRKVK